MVKCKICEKVFKNNLGGDLTKHLKQCHNMSLEEYIILNDYNGIEPKCKCGLCNEKPYFNRGKFTKYAIGHNKHDWMEKKYIENHGVPKCLNCNKNVTFYRGIPRKFCSSECVSSYNGNNWNQEKIKKTIKEKYNVDNVFQLENIKKKSKNTMNKKYGNDFYSQTKNGKEKIKNSNLKKYGTTCPFTSETVINKSKKTMIKKYGVDHFSKTFTFRSESSKRMCEYNRNLKTNHKIKRYKDTKLYYQSKYELRFIEYCKKNNLLSVLDNSPTFKYLDKKYGKWHLPDFKFRDMFIIEIKSTYWMNKQGGMEIINAKKESVEKLGYQYVFMLDEDYSNFLKIL